MSNPTGKIKHSNTTISVMAAHRLGFLIFLLINLYKGANMLAIKTAQKIAKKKGIRMYAKKTVIKVSNMKKILFSKSGFGLYSISYSFYIKFKRDDHCN
jgi:hypothetical protein